MISLFIDTSSIDVSIALIKDNNVLTKIVERIPNQHSVYTTSYIDKVFESTNIKPVEVDKIFVVNGPGSFTGVRIGVTIAKTMAYLLNKEIICLSSLKIRALSVGHDYCLVLINANKDNYYVGLYDKDNNEVIDEQFSNVDNVKELISKYNPVIVSDKEFSFDDRTITDVQLDFVNIINYYQDKESVNVHLVVPNYLKLPQALEEKK